MAAIGWNQQTLYSRQLTTSGVLANNDQRNVVTNRRYKTGCYIILRHVLNAKLPHLENFLCRGSQFLLMYYVLKCLHVFLLCGI
jgi:hypothetical protein